MAAYDQYWRPAGDPGGYWGRGSIRQNVDSPAYALFGWRGPLRTGDERPKNAIVQRRLQAGTTTAATPGIPAVDPLNPLMPVGGDQSSSTAPLVPLLVIGALLWALS